VRFIKRVHPLVWLALFIATCVILWWHWIISALSHAKDL